MDLNRTKRIVYISIGVSILGVLGYFFVNSLFLKEPGAREDTGRITGRAPGSGLFEPKGQPEELGQPLEIKISGKPEQKLVRLSDFPVVSPSLDSSQTKVRFYRKDGGDLLQSDLNGENQGKISNLTIVGLVEALWNPAGDRAAVFYLDVEHIKSFLHIGTTSTAALPQDLQGFSWSPDGKSLIFLQRQNDRLNLVVADSLGRGARTIFSTPILDLQIQRVSTDKIYMQTAPSGLAEGFAFLFSRSSGAFSRILGPLFGLTTLVSPDGSKILVASTDTTGRDLRLSVTDSAGKVLFNVTPPTLPQKCRWTSNQKAYCAIPRDSLAGFVLPDEYLRGELNTSDRIVRIDLENKKIEEVFNQEDLDVSDLVVTKDESHLLFVDRKNGNLWSLKIR